MRPHIVTQGEHLKQLAFRYGFDATDVWNHPKNAALKSARGSGDILLPGDIVYLPDALPKRLPLNREGDNKYVAQIPAITLDVRFVLEDGTPMAAEPYFISGIGSDHERMTDADGHAQFDAPVTSRQIQVVFPRRYVSYALLIGDLDPVAAPSGVAARLANLGYYARASAASVSSSASVRRAVIAFQHDQGMAETGDVDEATRAAISRAYGI